MYDQGSGGGNGGWYQEPVAGSGGGGGGGGGNTSSWASTPPPHATDAVTNYSSTGGGGGSVGGGSSSGAATTEGSHLASNDDEDFDNEPPLLEGTFAAPVRTKRSLRSRVSQPVRPAELGINFVQVQKKTEIILTSVYKGRGMQIDSEILADTDMAGPLVFCLALGGALLLVRACLLRRARLMAAMRSRVACIAWQSSLRGNLRPGTAQRYGNVCTPEPDD